ncbi:MAG: hypothetical protein AAF491_01760 [Verrucomicrobiota bacterium]
MNLRHLLLVGIGLTSSLLARGMEPSEYRLFTDKRDLQIEARILSISEDQRTMQLQRKDGNVFEMAITVLSLEDQQFIQQWLRPAEDPSAFSLAVFGQLPGGKELPVEEIKGLQDVREIFTLRPGWVALHNSGEISSSDSKLNGLEGIAQLTCNTNWIMLVNEDGEVLNRRLEVQHPDVLKDAVLSVAGSGHMAALLPDGRVKIWGSHYEGDAPMDLPGEFPPIVSLATNQGTLTALDETGTLHQWRHDWEAVKSARHGDGFVAVEGSIFTFLALTNSGEVYEWNGDATKAKIPATLKDKGPFVKIRCNGNTRAVQQEDGTWIAWGTNGSGIVDKINALPPTPDLTFFSEPGKLDHGHLLYREPKS